MLKAGLARLEWARLCPVTTIRIQRSMQATSSGSYAGLKRFTADGRIW